MPAAFRNFLALLGWSPDTTQYAAEITVGDSEVQPNLEPGDEIFSQQRLIELFSLDRIHKSPAVFNFQENDPRHWTDDKALWMNAEYIRTMPLAELLPMVKAELRAEKLWREEYDDDESVWFEQALKLIRQRFFTLKDFSSQGRAYFSEDFDFDEAAVRKNILKEPKLKELLPALADRMDATEPFSAADAEATLRAFSEVVNPDAYRRAANLIETGTMVLVKGKLERDDEATRILASEIASIDTVAERLSREVAIRNQDAGGPRHVRSARPGHSAASRGSARVVRDQSCHRGQRRCRCARMSRRRFASSHLRRWSRRLVNRRAGLPCDEANAGRLFGRTHMRKHEKKGLGTGMR